MNREIDTSMITEEQMIQIRRNAEEDIKLEEMEKENKARRNRVSKRRRAYRSVYAEAAEACGLVKCRVNGKIYWE